MLSSIAISHVKLAFFFSLLTLGCATSCMKVSGSRPQTFSSKRSNDLIPSSGIRITKVYEGSSAEKAGLRPMDVLSGYGEFELVDHASYFKARDTYEGLPGARVQLVAWRGRMRMTPTVPSGRLGIEMNEYNAVSYEFESLITKLKTMSELSENAHDPEFKQLFAKPPEKVIEEARQLLDRADQEGTLTPAQVIVGRICMIPDDAPPEDLQKQSELLAQLISTQPASYISFLGHDVFFEKERYRPAIECFKEQLKADPSDVSLRLNLGIALYSVGMFDEAEAAADYVITNKLGLSEHGFLVFYQVKSMAALGQRDYRKGIFFGEKAFELQRETFQISLVQLAAAQIGDLGKLAEASERFQNALPDKYAKMKFQVDAVEAYGLVKNNQRDRAQRLVLKWKGTNKIEGKLSRYWGVYPGGADIVKNWKDLMHH